MSWKLSAMPGYATLHARVALLIPNPLMPASVAHSHLWETLLSDLLLGAIVGWVLAADAKPTGQGQTQVMSAGIS